MIRPQGTDLTSYVLTVFAKTLETQRVCGSKLPINDAKDFGDALAGSRWSLLPKFILRNYLLGLSDCVVDIFI